MRGRLVVIDGSTASGARDTDADGFQETIELSHKDAALFIQGQHEALCAVMKERLGAWDLFPQTEGNVPAAGLPAEAPPVRSNGAETTIESIPQPAPAQPIEPEEVPSLMLPCPPPISSRQWRPWAPHRQAW